jgi:hypothetical protein
MRLTRAHPLRNGSDERDSVPQIPERGADQQNIAPPARIR